MRSVSSWPSTSARVVITPSMYAGACTTTPTRGTRWSEKRNGASSIPRNRDFDFISHQLEGTRDLIDDRVRAGSDAEARHGAGRQLRQTGVLDERGREAE